MKKIYWLVGVFCCVFVWQTEAVYVRKLKEPVFFIPEKDRMHKQEKLPVIKNNVNKKNNKEKPEYKKKVDKYMNDLKQLDESGILPKDKELENDLADMQTGDIFVVDENMSENLNSEETKNFYLLVDDVLKN